MKKLFVLLTDHGFVRSPKLVSEKEIGDNPHIEVIMPWERPLPINPGGRGKSLFDLKPNDPITFIRVPKSIVPIVKAFAVWLYNN